MRAGIESAMCSRKCRTALYSGDGSVDPGTGKRTTTVFSAANATKEGTWENEVVKADLKKLAGYLKLLRDKRIPVIWRPLHEAAGNIYNYKNGKAWFWWGNDGAEAYKKLWIYIFNYFKKEGINNLIWVWTTQTKDSEFYPGMNTSIWWGVICILQRMSTLLGNTVSGSTVR